MDQIPDLELSYFIQIRGLISHLPNVAKEQITVEIPGIKKPHSYRAEQIALLAALCYIDGYGKCVYGKASKRNFVKVLVEHGGNLLFQSIHPKTLKDCSKKPRIKKNVKKIFVKIESFLDSLILKNKFYEEDKLLHVLRGCGQLTETEINTITLYLYHGSYAALIYEYMRCPYVHELSSSKLFFNDVDLQDQLVPSLAFVLVYTILTSGLLLSSMEDEDQTPPIFAFGLIEASLNFMRGENSINCMEFKDKPVPKLNFDLIYAALTNISESHWNNLVEYQ